MGIRAAAGLIVATLCVPVIAAADDSVTFAELSRGDQVRVRLTSGGHQDGPVGPRPGPAAQGGADPGSGERP